MSPLTADRRWTEFDRHGSRVVPVCVLILLSTGCGRDEPPNVAEFVPVDSEVSTDSASPAGPSETVDTPTTGIEPALASMSDESVDAERDEEVEATVADRPPDQPQRVYRPTVAPPGHDDERAAELGIQRYESRRLVLYSDIDPEIAATLPPLLDLAYAAWTEYFGLLPPDRDGTDFQLTGYIMREKDRFQAAGMLPDEALRSLEHGLHRGLEFWMNEQEYDYYRRHLLIHEGTHCFMMVMPDVRLPLWYLEGMAEYFGAHRLYPDGSAEFGLMPDDPRDFVGFGRVEMIREEIAAGESRTVRGVTELSLDDFTESKSGPYAWSWALCKFMDEHPRYSERFRELGRHLEGGQFYELLQSSFNPDMPILWAEWEHFSRTLTYGHDIARAAIDFERGVLLAGPDPATMELRSDQGWQSSGVWLEAGTSYAIEVDGEVVLANEPRPWISQPQGVSIEYAGSRPVGRVIAAIQSEQAPAADATGSLLKTFDIGRSTVLMPTVAGTLYLRVNDAWNGLSNNTGSFHVTIRQDPGIEALP